MIQLGSATNPTLAIYPYPLQNTSTPFPPTPTKEPGYPYPPTITPFHPVCEEDYHLNFDGVTTTPTVTPSIWFPKDATLSVEEIGNTNPEESVKMLLGKYLTQFKSQDSGYWILKSYEIYQISIFSQSQCHGPNQLENYWGHLGYAVEPGDMRKSNWWAGGAVEVKPGWISNGTDFILIKTRSYFELKLTGNG